MVPGNPYALFYWKKAYLFLQFIVLPPTLALNFVLSCFLAEKVSSLQSKFNSLLMLCILNIYPVRGKQTSLSCAYLTFLSLCLPFRM